MRPLQAASVLLAIAAVAFGVWWIARSGAVATPVAAPARFEALAAEERAPASEVVAPPAAAVEVPAPGGIQPEGGASAALGPLGGRVVDVEGRPIAGARVFASRALTTPYDSAIELRGGTAPFASIQVRSGEDGRFTFAPGIHGELRLAVRAPGFAPLRESRRVAAGDTELGELALAKGVTLAGRVTDARGAPLVGAELRSIVPGAAMPATELEREQNEPLAATDASGAFRTDELEAGPFRLYVSHPEHLPRVIEGRSRAAGAVLEPLAIALEDGAAIGGVVSAPDGSRIDGLRAGAALVERGTARVPFETACVRTAPVGEDGSFSLLGLEAEREYEVAVFRPSPNAFVLAPCTECVRARGGEHGLQIEWEPGTRCIGRVLDASSGMPIEDARFEVLGNGWSGVERLERQPDGRFVAELAAFAPRSDPIALRVSAPGRAPLVLRDLELQCGEELDLGDLRLDDLQPFDLRVVDASDASPIEGAELRLRIVARAADGERELPDAAFDAQIETTGADGRARFAGCPGRRARLFASAVGYAPFRGEAFDLPARSGTELAIELARDGAIEVRVVDAEGGPVPDLTVHARGCDFEGRDGEQEEEFAAAARTDRRGVARFEHLGLGRYAVGLVRVPLEASSTDAGSDGLLPGWRELDVESDCVAQLELRLAPQASLSGFVLSDGAPLGGATLALIPDDRTPGLPRAYADSDALGRYAFRFASPGRYTLVVEHFERAMPQAEAVELALGANERDVELDRAHVEGRVTDSAGRPLADAWVSAESADRSRAWRGASQRNLMTLDGFAPARAVETPQAGWVRTDADGRYRLEGVRSGSPVFVAARDEDHLAARSEAFELARDGCRAGIDLALEPGGRIDVCVLDGSGRAVTDATVYAHFLSERPADPVGPRRTGSSPESHSLRGLTPGKWRLSTSFADAPVGGGPDEIDAVLQPVEVDVVGGEARRVEIRLP